MINLTSQIKSIAREGRVSENSAIKIAEQGDNFLQQAVDLLKRAEKETGMILGSAIEEFMSALKGQRFNETEFFYEKMPNEQR